MGDTKRYNKSEKNNNTKANTLKIHTRRKNKATQHACKNNSTQNQKKAKGCHTKTSAQFGCLVCSGSVAAFCSVFIVLYLLPIFSVCLSGVTTLAKPFDLSMARNQGAILRHSRHFLSVLRSCIRSKTANGRLCPVVQLPSPSFSRRSVQMCANIVDGFWFFAWASSIGVGQWG